MERLQHLSQVGSAFELHPVTALLGPRQCGKTTLARQYLQQLGGIPAQNYFDLEDHFDLERLDNPRTALNRLSGLIVIDEIQRRPELFPTLRVLVDQPDNDKQFLILGSASRDLIKQSSETLAGRIEYLELTPFSYFETKELPALWQRGGFPLSYLADTEEKSNRWRENYIQTFLEVELAELSINIAPELLRRFWMMLSHYHGNYFNASEIGRSLGLSHTTIRHYADILTGTFMVRQLQPWFENIGKRQVKSPKIYLRDSGLFHRLMGIDSVDQLLRHPKLGASWEGFALEEIIRKYRARPPECFFWAVHSSAEIDLLIMKSGKKLGFEFKYQDAPKVTKSIHTALETLNLDKVFLIYPGDKHYEYSDRIEVVGLEPFLNPH